MVLIREITPQYLQYLQYLLHSIHRPDTECTTNKVWSVSHHQHPLGQDCEAAYYLPGRENVLITFAFEKLDIMLIPVSLYLVAFPWLTPMLNKCQYCLMLMLSSASPRVRVGEVTQLQQSLCSPSLTRPTEKWKLNNKSRVNRLQRSNLEKHSFYSTTLLNCSWTLQALQCANSVVISWKIKGETIWQNPRVSGCAMPGTTTNHYF